MVIKMRKILHLLIASAFIIVLLSVCSVSSFAASGTTTEAAEPNDDYTQATRTYDDYDNFG